MSESVNQSAEVREYLLSLEPGDRVVNRELIELMPDISPSIITRVLSDLTKRGQLAKVETAVRVRTNGKQAKVAVQLPDVEIVRDAVVLLMDGVPGIWRPLSMGSGGAS